MEMSLEPYVMNEAIRKAIVSGDLQYVFDLLNSGLDVNHMIPFNDEDIIDTYVMRDSKKMKLCDVESKNSNSHKWFDEQEQEVMRMIDLISSIPDKTNHSLSLIHVAVRIENIELLAFLLKRKVKDNILDYNYNTPLLYAVSKKNICMVQSLIAYGVDINIENKNGCSALELALLKRQDLIVQCLILAGADLGHNKNSNSPILKKPLHLALQIGQVNSFALMLDRDIDINYVEPSGSCILDICLEALQLNNISSELCTSIFKNLMERGAKINFMKSYPNIPSNFFRYGNIEMLDMLTAAGLEICLYQQHDQKFLPPLHEAIDNSDDKMIKHLIHRYKLDLEHNIKETFRE
ncbi:hypothetical protein QAD02_012556 [Eretmocerus hayati]|uniref:Uncharacterized protein n=1 Tax=Eretmocerus hayati TaxID=131215 RepID=A0ACC2P0A9_9HYME|nr:hypothetical protein QAD02_012556 [Eretmocerus hayati]